MVLLWFLISTISVRVASAQVSYTSFVTPPDVCPIQCLPGQFHTKEGACGVLVQIGDVCDATHQCEPSYTACIGGRCKCLPSFVAINGHCYAQKYTCPGTGPITKVQQCVINVDECDQPGNGGSGTGFEAPKFGSRCLREGASATKVVSLNRVKRHTGGQSNTAYQWNGGCPSGSYCSVSDGYLIKGCHAYAMGHCCPHSCPRGEPHPSASCDPGAYNSCDKIPGYSCYRNYLTPGALTAFGEMMDNYFPKTCCPTNCPSGWTTVDTGHCYPPAEGLDHACWRDDQCFDRQCSGAQCQCEPPLRRIVYPGGGEGCINATSTKKLGEPCSVDKLEVCGVEHSKCYNGRCVCNCNYASVGNTKCVRKPPCPNDVSYSCGNWARSGECKRNPNWMIQNCPRACGVC